MHNRGKRSGGNGRKKWGAVLGVVRGLGFSAGLGHLGSGLSRSFDIFLFREDFAAFSFALQYLRVSLAVLILLIFQCFTEYSLYTTNTNTSLKCTVPIPPTHMCSNVYNKAFGGNGIPCCTQGILSWTKSKQFSLYFVRNPLQRNNQSIFFTKIDFEC